MLPPVTESPDAHIECAPCEVCGDQVPEGLRYMAGPFAGRMFCEDHDPLRGGPRAGYPELGEPRLPVPGDRYLAPDGSLR